MIRIGEKIPDLSLQVYHGGEIKEVKLSDFRGRWIVIAFYPADFTFVCPTELEELADHYDELRRLGAEVISVSTDTVYVHKAWHGTSPAIKKIRFHMAADPAGVACRAFGSYIHKEGIPWRATFIVDPEGMLRAMEMHDNSIGRSVKEIIRKLQAAKYVAEHPGEVCPASWEPGRETLKPSLELVGEI
jgi:peroxiredoxin (alkyl hydroperoxide reductase subunit C)